MRNFLIILAILLNACNNTNTQVAEDETRPASSIEPTNQVVLASDVEWGPLNPARGDASPQAANLWGDRAETGATGFLVQFADGFSSPPHIHNVTYRGIVISGLIHNDDPAAANMWLPAGSFWTQPAGEAHITSADGSHNMAYIEIEEGPYLVQPTEEAFDNGERPVNVDESNLVWLDASNLRWIDLPESPALSTTPQIAYLWGQPQDGQLSGSLLKLPAGFSGQIHSLGASFRAVVVKGQPEYIMPEETKAMNLEPGSLFSSDGEALHQVSSSAGEETILYIRAEGRFRVEGRLIASAVTASDQTEE